MVVSNYGTDCIGGSKIFFRGLNKLEITGGDPHKLRNMCVRLGWGGGASVPSEPALIEELYGRAFKGNVNK